MRLKQLRWSHLEPGMVLMGCIRTRWVIYHDYEVQTKIVPLEEIKFPATVLSAAQRGKKKAVSLLNENGPFWIGTGDDDAYDFWMRLPDEVDSEG